MPAPDTPASSEFDLILPSSPSVVSFRRPFRQLFRQPSDDLLPTTLARVSTMASLLPARRSLQLSLAIFCLQNCAKINIRSSTISPLGEKSRDLERLSRSRTKSEGRPRDTTYVVIEPVGVRGVGIAVRPVRRRSLAIVHGRLFSNGG